MGVGRVEGGVIDVGAHDLPGSPGPVAEQGEPSVRPAADVKGAQPGPGGEPAQKVGTGSPPPVTEA